MKKVLLFLLALAAAVSMGSAQKVIVDDDIYTTSSIKRFSKIAGGTISGVVYATVDSVTSLPVSKTFTIGLNKVTLSPDSIQWYWWAKGHTTADSVGLYPTVVPLPRGGAYATRFPVDSILANENDYKTLATQWWQGAETLKAVIATTNVAGVLSKNQYKTNGGSYIVLKQRRFFTIK